MIDRMTQADADAAGALSAELRWPHRVQDWQAFLAIGQGFAWRQDGALAGTALCVLLDAAHAAIGLVQVAPAWQGRGIGRRLMQAAMQAAGARSLCLHATPEGVGLYTKLGFEPLGTVEQWQGLVTAGPQPQDLRAAEPGDRAAIAALDRHATGLARAHVLESLGRDAPAVVAGPAGAICAYALRRSFGRGQHIGPVIAATETEAAALIAALQTPGFLRLDLHAGTTTLAAHLHAIGLACVDRVQVMARGPWPRPPGPTRCYALLSQALG